MTAIPAIGSLTSAATEPMVAGSYQTIVQTYTAGDMGMAVGGGIILARHFMADQGPPYQSERPEADNYVSIRCSNPAAKFAAEREQMSGMHGGFRNAADTLAYLCTSPYDVRLAQERFPKIHFHPLREHAGLALQNAG